jgi:hypothetical protein
MLRMVGRVPQYPGMANDDRICPNCRGLVTRGEEFCTTCGEWLGIAGADEPEQFTLTSDGPVAPAGTRSSPAPPPSQLGLRCPLCGSDNPANNRHCEQCGARLASGQMPVAPQPAIQTTAAMRTAIVAAVVLLAVVGVAFVVNALRGEQVEPVDTTTTSTTVQSQVRQAVITGVTCSAEWGSRPCSNLIDGTGDDWNAPIPPAGETLTITLQLEQPYAVRYIQLLNLEEDDPRFLRNYRVRGVRITSSDVASPISKSLSDTPGELEPIDFLTMNSLSVTIEIVSWWASQSVGEGADVQPGFDDLSIAEIRIWGTPGS